MPYLAVFYAVSPSFINTHVLSKVIDIMVFKGLPRRRLGVQAGKKLRRPGCHESSAYGDGSRRLGVDFQQGGRENERESARLHFPPRILNERGKVRGKERGRRPPAPGILRGGALLQQSSRAHSPIPWLQPLLLQSICNSASSSSSPTNLDGLPPCCT